jgi:ABC-type multidrug transport system permease subunit
VTERAPTRSPLVELTLARVRLFFREPSAVFWTFGFPIIMAVALGVAFRNKPPDPVPVAIEEGPGAEAIRAQLEGPTIHAVVEGHDAASAALRGGKVALVVVAGPPRTYRFDESRPESRLVRLTVDDRLQRADGRADVRAVVDEHVTEPGSRYIDFLVPGLVGMTLMQGSMWGIGYLIVEMRTKKLVKRLLATPMRKGDFLASFVLMRAFFVLVEVPVLFAFGWLVFGVRIAGSIPLLLGVGMLGALTFAGVGVLVASRADNVQTVGGLMNLVMMPMFIGSGIFFSTDRFPEVLQPLIKALPLTALNDAMRAVVNEGAGPVAIAPQLGLMAAVGVLSFAIALRIFRWR